MTLPIALLQFDSSGHPFAAEIVHVHAGTQEEIAKHLAPRWLPRTVQTWAIVHSSGVVFKFTQAPGIVR